MLHKHTNTLGLLKSLWMTGGSNSCNARMPFATSRANLILNLNGNCSSRIFLL